MNHLTMTPIKSSMISGVHYDNDTHQLTVEFPGGRSYVYHDVPREKYDGLLAAASAGKYFATHIRNQHRHSKVAQAGVHPVFADIFANVLGVK